MTSIMNNIVNSIMRFTSYIVTLDMYQHVEKMRNFDSFSFVKNSRINKLMIFDTFLPIIGFQRYLKWRISKSLRFAAEGNKYLLK